MIGVGENVGFIVGVLLRVSVWVLVGVLLCVRGRWLSLCVSMPLMGFGWMRGSCVERVLRQPHRGQQRADHRQSFPKKLHSQR
jgi:hypothetical protein